MQAESIQFIGLNEKGKEILEAIKKYVSGELNISPEEVKPGFISFVVKVKGQFHVYEMSDDPEVMLQSFKDLLEL